MFFIYNDAEILEFMAVKYWKIVKIKLILNKIRLNSQFGF